MMLPRLHVVTHDGVLARSDFAQSAKHLLQLGDAVALHLRGHHTSASRIYELAQSLDTRKGWLVINDRVDVALCVGADAVQLGTRSLPPKRARPLLPESAVIGASVHSADEALAMQESGAEYLLVGTIYSTSSHPGRPGAGPQRIRDVQRRTILPIIAIGGITNDTIGEVRAAGAHGIAVTSAVWDAPDPVRAAQDLLAAMGVAAEESSVRAR